MKEKKLYICAGVFILLTAIRLTLPSFFSDISRELRLVFEMEKRHTDAILELGASLSDDAIAEIFHRNAKNAPSEPLHELVIGIPEWISEPEFPEQSPAVTPTPTPTPTPDPTPTPEPTVPPAVAAFLESQEAFSDYDVPQNVSYEYPELPFDYASPVQGIASSGFGYRLHPIQNEVKFHYGTDFGAGIGTPVCAFADGTVRYIGENDSYGKYIMLDHAGGYSSFYAHCSEILKSSGSVKMGEEIARVGQTGAATGPHLHFELEQGSTYLNPEFYL